MTNDDQFLPPLHPLNPSTLRAEMQQLIRQLQARQVELEAENQALRQAPVKWINGAEEEQPADGDAAQAQQQTLQQRLKEQRCLYKICVLLNQDDLGQDELAQAIVDQLPAVYQFPAIACASLIIGDQRAVTSNYLATPWQQSSIVRAGESTFGTLTVGYLEECPTADEGPFLHEERSFIDEVSAQVGRALEHRRLHGALADRAGMLHSILTASQDIIYRYRFWPKPGFDYVSPAVTALVGYTPEEHYTDPELGMKLVHPDDRQMLEEIAAGVESRDLLRFTIRWVRKDGGIIHTEHRCSFIHDATGRVVAYDGIARDVTARVEQEASMRASEERYRSLFLSSLNAILISRADGSVMESNPAASALFGWSHEEFEDLAYASLVKRDDLRLSEFLVERSKTGHARGELAFVRKDGATFEGEVSSSSYRDAAGNVLASLSVHDISARLEVRTQQQYLATVLAHIPDAVISVDAEFRILSWNAAAEHLYGWQAGDVLGRPLGAVIGTHFGTTHAAIWQSMVEAGDWHGELEQQQRNGHTIRVRAAIAALHAAGGTLTGCVYISHDITAERRAEEARVASERLFRTLTENTSDGVLLAGLDQQLHYASPAAVRILGFPLAELLQPGAIVVHPDDLEAIEASWRQINTTPEQAIHQSYRVLHQDGAWRWIETTATNLLSDPVVQAVVVNLRDVTERKLAEIELAASNARFKSLFENMPMGVVYHDLDGHITLANRAAEQILGLSHDQLMGRASLDPRWEAVCEDGTVFPGDEHPAMVALHTGQIVTDVLMGVYHPAKDERRWIRIAAVPEFRPGEIAPYRVFAIFDDITERRQSEHAIAEAEHIYRTTILAAGAVPYRYDYDTESYTLLPVEAEQLTGYPLEEITPTLVRSMAIEAIPRGQYAGLSGAEAIARAHSGQGASVWQCDYRIRTHSGEERWLADRSVLVANEQGRRIASVGILLDITEHVHAEATLRASEERYRRLAEELEVRVTERTAEVGALNQRLNFLLLHTPAIIYTATLCKRRLTTTFLSESTYRLLGYPPEEHRNDPDFWAGLMHPDDAESEAEFIAELAATGSALWEHRVRHANGDYRWHTTGMNRLQANADPAQFIGYSVDIHERKLALDALRVSEARYRSVLNNAPANITEIDRNGTILSQNRTLLGQPAGSLIGQTLFAVAPPNAADAIRNALHAIFEEGQNVRYESRLEVAPGNARHFVSYAGRIEGDHIDAAVIVTMDITDRKAAEAELQRQRDFAQQVMDTMGEGLVISDRDHRAEYVNPRMAQMLEFSPAELLGKTMDDFIPSEAWPGLAEMLAEHLPEDTYQYELGVRTRSGRIVPMLVSSVPRWENGELAGHIAIFTDLTRVKQIESDLRRSSDELSAANVAIKQAMQMKDEFLASMSHELRTPLTGILGLSESLQLQTAGTLNERQLRAVSYIWESGQHLLELINDILDLSKLSANQLELDPVPCAVRQICEASLTLVKGMAAKKSQSIALDIEPEGIVLLADVRRLKQMLVNLLSNAIKFTPNGGELGLHVRGDLTRQVVEFCVWDKGIGIAAKDLPRIFEAFTQVDSSLTRQQPGSGLGLALVQRMARLHGGTIEVSSELGAGSEFTLTLPWLNAQEFQAPPPSAPVFAVTRAPDQPEAPMEEPPVIRRLLVAENDPVNAEMLLELLTAQGYSVAVASDGLEVLQMASSFAPELILMDIRMPRMNGIEAICRLRVHPDPKVATAPIIALTAQAMEGDAERCLAAGASTYLVKPFNIRVLLATIAEQLAAKGASSSPMT